jgi:hypothetical protein
MVIEKLKINYKPLKSIIKKQNKNHKNSQEVKLIRPQT